MRSRTPRRKDKVRFAREESLENWESPLAPSPSKPPSEDVGLGTIWISAPRRKPVLCVMHSESTSRNSLWSNAHTLMEQAVSADVHIDDSRTEMCWRRAFSGLELRGLFWSLATANGCCALGLGSNKTGRIRATKLALALTFACLRNVKLDGAMNSVVTRARRQAATPVTEVLPYICALSQETTPRNTSECDGARTRTLLAQRSPSPPRPSSIETPAVAQGSYVARWREEAKPRKRASLVPAPAGACEASSRELLFRWLKERELTDVLDRGRYEDDAPDWFVFDYTPDRRVLEPQRLSEDGGRWELAFHGTWFYGLWVILTSGALLESSDPDLEDDFSFRGVQCSSSIETARSNTHPHHLFGDGVYHRVMLDVRFDRSQLKRGRRRGGGQLILPSSAVAITGVRFQMNAAPCRCDERLDTWDSTLEALPARRTSPSVIHCNTPRRLKHKQE